MDLVIVVIAFFIAVVLVEAIWSKREEKKAEREREREREEEERKYLDPTKWHKVSESTETEVEKESAMFIAENPDTPYEVEKLYTLSELVPIIDVTHRTLVKYVNEGKLKATKINRVWRVKESDLNEFMNGRKKQ